MKGQKKVEKKHIKLSLLLFTILILSSFCFFAALSVNTAYAAESDTWEYITHGGYDAAVEAWKRVALIFSSTDYKTLLAVVFIFGFFIGFISILLKAAFGVRASFHAWLPLLLMSAVVYEAFILPKNKVVIYDETLNRGPYEVDDIPVLAAAIAGGLNKAEQVIINLIATSSDPVEDYRYNPAGISFSALGSVDAKQIPSYIYRSVYNYFKDCIIPTAVIGTPFTFDDLIAGRVLLKDAITGSANPSLFTVIYDSNGTDSTLSCKDASTAVYNYISTEANFDPAIMAGCARVGYDPDSTASFQQCKNMMQSSVTFLLEKAGISATSDLLTPIQQLLFADITKEYVLTHGPEAIAAYLATQKTASSFIGLGIHANNWIPELREAFTAVAISLTPLILLLLVTPLAGRAILLLMGMFLWLGMWGIIDAVITSFGLSMASECARYLASGSANEGLGLFAASVLPNATAKIYAIFGALRWSGLMLASVMSALLVRFGGTALAMLAGQIAAQPMGSGGAAGSAVSSEPVQTMSNLIVPTQAWANAAAAEGIKSLMSGMSSMQYAELAGRSSVGSSFAPSTLLQTEMNKLISGIGEYGSMSSKEAFQVGMMKAYREVGQTKGFLSLADEIRKDPALRKMLGVSENASSKEIFEALYKAGAYAFGAENAGKFAALVKEGKLSAAALQSMVEYKSKLEGFENYLKEEFAEDFRKNPYLAGRKLAQRLSEVNQARLALEAKKGELGHELIEKIEGFNWANPAVKAIQRMVLMDKLDDGVISTQTQELVRGFKEWGRKFFGSDIDTIMGHFSNFDFVVQNENQAEQLRKMGVNADVGDAVHIDYANLVKGEHGYDLQITRDNVKVFKPHDVKILGHRFSFAGGEIEKIGDEKHGSLVLKHGHLVFDGGKFAVDTIRQEIINGRQMLKEFSGAYQGDVKGLEKLLNRLGIYDQVKTNSKAWEKLKAAADSGKAIHLNYDNGNLVLEIKSETGYEKVGTFAVKRTVDTKDVHYSGHERVYSDIDTVKVVKGTSSDTNPVTAIKTAENYIKTGRYGKAEKILLGLTDKSNEEKVISSFVNTYSPGYSVKWSKGSKHDSSNVLNIYAEGDTQASAGFEIAGIGVKARFKSGMRGYHTEELRDSSGTEVSVNPYAQEFKNALRHARVYMQLAEEAREQGDMEGYHKYMKMAADSLNQVATKAEFERKAYSLAEKYGVADTLAYKIIHKLYDLVTSGHKPSVKEITDYVQNLMEKDGIKVPKEARIEDYIESLINTAQKYGIAPKEEDYYKAVIGVAQERNIDLSSGVIGEVAHWAYEHGVNDKETIINMLETLREKGINDINEAARFLHDKDPNYFK